MQVNNCSNVQLNQNFSGKDKKEIQPVQIYLSDFVNASDEDLFYLAKAKNNQKHKNDTAKFMGACVGVDALSSVLLKNQVLKKVGDEIQVVKAPLSAKLGAGLKTIKNWGIGFAAVGVLMGVKNILMKKSEKFRDAEENHPMMSLMAEIGVLALGYKGVQKVGSKLGASEKFIKKTAPVTKKIGKLAKKIDNSKFATFVMNRGAEIVNKVGTKAPAFGKTCRLLLANSVLIMLIGGMMKINKNNKEVQQTYENLKLAQNEIRENLSF